MRRIFQLSVLCVVAGAASACKPDATEANPLTPTAGVRFINAVPDTGAAFGIDFRFIDRAENSDAFRITFRNTPQTASGVTASTAVQYKAAAIGTRPFRIFLDDTLQTVVLAGVLKDSTVTLEANHNYTFLLWGNARSTGADKMRLTVIDETVADPGQQVALRVINTTNQAIDVRQYASSGSLPASPTWASVAPYTVSGYVTASPATMKFNVQPAGGGTALFTPDVTALTGQPVGTDTGNCVVGLDCAATPGTTVPGSAVTLIVFPASVKGSKAAQFTTIGGAFVWDRRPTTACTVAFGC
jgi:hypothetical protein